MFKDDKMAIKITGLHKFQKGKITHRIDKAEQRRVAENVRKNLQRLGYVGEYKVE